MTDDKVTIISHRGIETGVLMSDNHVLITSVEPESPKGTSFKAAQPEGTSFVAVFGFRELGNFPSLLMDDHERGFIEGLLAAGMWLYLVPSEEGLIRAYYRKARHYDDDD